MTGFKKFDTEEERVMEVNTQKITQKSDER